MKTLLRIIITIALTITLWYQANAQTYQGSAVKFSNDKWNITATIDKDFTESEAIAFFTFLDQAFGKNMKDRYLITKSGTYYRPGLSKRKPKKLS
jgi:hypothetical protein